MGKFWFEIMQPTFGEDNIQLLYTGKKLIEFISNKINIFRH